MLLQLPQVLRVTRLGRAKVLEGLPEWPACSFVNGTLQELLDQLYMNPTLSNAVLVSTLSNAVHHARRESASAQVK